MPRSAATLATFVKTPAGRWKAVVRIQGFPTTSKTFRLKRDAESWANRTEDEIRRDVYVDRAPSVRLSFKDAMEQYLKEVTPTKAPSTQPRERSRARILLAHFDGYSLAAIKPQTVSDYVDERFEVVGSPDTVRLELALLSNLFTKAIKKWNTGLQINPVSLVEKPGKAERNRRLNGWREARKLFEACAEHSNPMLLWIVKLALYTAMRKSEIRNLRVSQIDLPRARITLQAADTKNSRTRVVPLTERAERVLRDALANPLRPHECDLVFFGDLGKNGKRSGYVFDKVWREVLLRAGIRDLRFHDLRHEATSVLIESGKFDSDIEVMKMTGHSSTQMLKRYAHLRDRYLVDKVRRYPVHA